ncbi:hypothetical protein [Mycolicibacterium sp.]|uniref:hypothetical protein n=1 Tax=Mycolicibacterium sp. TaxID=2320850 RepID=UPI003D0AB7AC
MPPHTISPDPLLASLPAARSRRPSLVARLTARLRAADSDRALAVGVRPEPGSALAAHRTRVTSEAERSAVARALRQALRDATEDGAVWSSRVPVHAENVTTARELIDRVTLRLHAPRPVGPLGMARLRLLLADGSGPLYRRGRGDLSGRLGAALAEL